VKKTVYSVIAEQYEKARIIESKNTPTITILDPARPPEVRSSPQRKKLVVAFFVLSILYGFGLAVVCESFERMRENREKFARVFNMLDKFAEEVKPYLQRLKFRK
jgi:uncharacterized protein involved in exopolysaccharide biosynthesis